MGVRLKLRDKEFIRALRGATGEGIQRATVFCHTQGRLLVNKPNTGRRVKVKRPVKGGNNTSRTVYDNPSQPGEPPRKRTGFGQRNIVWSYDPGKMVGRYGVTKNGLYMFFLELGTRRIAARPWMMKALTNNLRMVVALLQTGKRKRGL
jgi:hypothetical protein